MFIQVANFVINTEEVRAVVRKGKEVVVYWKTPKVTHLIMRCSCVEAAKEVFEQANRQLIDCDCDCGGMTI